MLCDACAHTRKDTAQSDICARSGGRRRLRKTGAVAVEHAVMSARVTSALAMRETLMGVRGRRMRLYRCKAAGAEEHYTIDQGSTLTQYQLSTLRGGSDEQGRRESLPLPDDVTYSRYGEARVHACGRHPDLVTHLCALLYTLY